MFSDQLGATIARQNTLQVEMRQALKNNHFELYFQPQLDVNENQIIGAEVLIRWQLEGQWVSPAEFIPLAERSGMILPLGDWILNHACHKAAEFVAKGHDELVIAVNISPKQFTHPGFVEKVKAALQQSSLDAQNLELEITEGVLFNNDRKASKTANKHLTALKSF
jgi:EAL domain-containing protein (putative c-di-GMP-specific phosphodiesterase class I)